MTEKYRVHEIARFNYSDIGEYIDENHTDRPLRNDILVELLNALNDENEQLKQFKDKVYSIIDKRINALENDYNKAVKAGMPSNSVYSEIELLKELKKELEE